MLKLLHHPDLSVSAAQVSGTLTADDYQKKLLPDLRGRLALYPKINWYFEMEEFTGWAPGALWDDITFSVRHARGFDRIAVVSGAKWERLLAPLMRPFTSATLKFFPISERDDAWSWVGRS